MTDSVEASGRTVEEAIDAALGLLDAREDEVEIQILSEGDEGDSLHRTDARVLVRFRDERSDEDRLVEREVEAAERARLREIPAEEARRHAEAVDAFLRGLLQTMTLEAEVEVRPTSSGAAVAIAGEDLAVLIGKHGATLAGLQELCRAVAQRAAPSRPIVTVDIAGYLERRAEILERMARSAAAQVRRSRRAIALDPMNARDRKIVHDALSGVAGVRTSSEGQEPNRYVVVSPQ